MQTLWPIDGIHILFSARSAAAFPNNIQSVGGTTGPFHSSSARTGSTRARPAVSGAASNSVSERTDSPLQASVGGVYEKKGRICFLQLVSSVMGCSFPKFSVIKNA